MKALPQDGQGRGRRKVVHEQLSWQFEGRRPLCNKSGPQIVSKEEVRKTDPSTIFCALCGRNWVPSDEQRENIEAALLLADSSSQA